jgi:predicted NAD/FAD-binding protein
MSPQRVAVIGAGISGLACAWLLARTHRVTLYAADDYLGGHTHTVDVTLEGVTHPVDTGFLVFNDWTYPNLIALFQQLGVATAPSEMSFSVRLPDADLEWAGTTLAALFAQPANLLRPRFWGMLADLLRFNREATAIARSGRTHDITVGEFLDQGRYGMAFRDWYLLPMCGAIWSCPTRSVLDFPADTLIRFCHNHGLLQVSGRPQWRTVTGGAREYVQRLASALPDVRTAMPVTRLTRAADGVTVTTAAGTEGYNQAVLACHSDQALALLADAAPAERDLLAAVPYQPNRAVLHTDRSFLPTRRAAWAAWNYHAEAGGQSMAVSYLINRLQPLPFQTPVIVTLNPEREPAPGTVLGAYDYMHPLFDARAIAAQAQLGAIQGVNRTWFCGAWTGYGFHEDGLKSGIAVAAALGCPAPWVQPAKALMPARATASHGGLVTVKQ